MAENLEQILRERETKIEKALLPSPFADFQSNGGYPGIDVRDSFTSDYRLRLPIDDPVRIEAEENGDLRMPGSEEASRALAAAHIAGLAVARRSSSRF